jgi:hypothetical protein
MNFRLLVSCLAALLLLASSPADAKRKTQQPPTPAEKQEPLPEEDKSLLQETLPATPKHTLVCSGVFAKDTTQAKLAAEFGAKNVVFKDVDGRSGTKDKATVLFDDDPTLRAVVYWRDVSTKSNPARINVSAPSTWVGPGGVHNGLPLKEVEEFNGGAFKLHGFGGEGSGLVPALKGKFGEVPGGCSLTARFEPGIANPLPPNFAAITGDKEILSSNPLMRRARPQVSEWTVNYH